VFQVLPINEFIRKATHPHPCPLPSRERGLKNRPSIEGSYLYFFPSLEGRG